MANRSDPRQGVASFATQAGTRGAAYDAGLRSYMLSVYNYMVSAVLLTGIIALAMAESGAIGALFTLEETSRGLTISPNLLGYVVMLAPLGFGMPLSFSRGGMKLGTLQFLFWGYAISLGLSLSTLFLAYTSASIAQVFFATAAGFAGLSLYGYTTKRDLSPMASFLFIGVIGLLVALVLNALLFQSGTFDLALSAVGVLIFAALTAFHTQMIKTIYDEVAGTPMEGKVAVLGAFRLYVTFINMFLFLLRLFGNSRN